MYIMNKVILTRVMTTIVLISMLFTTLLNAQTSQSSPANSGENYTITRVPAENGSYTISPKLPEDGKVPEGTLLTVTAKPATGYKLDAVYYTVKGGIWGTTNY